jgi:hypothetical protein
MKARPVKWPDPNARQNAVAKAGDGACGPPVSGGRWRRLRFLARVYAGGCAADQGLGLCFSVLLYRDGPVKTSAPTRAYAASGFRHLMARSGGGGVRADQRRHHVGKAECACW